MFEELDIAEIIGLGILGAIAMASIWKGEFGIANTIVGVVGGYLGKSVKNGITPAPPKEEKPKVG